MKLTLRGVPDDYRMNLATRAAILRYLKERLEIDIPNLGINMQFVEVTSPGRLPGKQNVLPLKVTVRGPSDISDIALSYIIEVLRDANVEISNDLKVGVDDLRGYENLNLSMESYNFDDLVSWDTKSPSKAPTPWTAAPVVVETVEVKVTPSPVVVIEEASTNVSWWVWLIIVLVVLLLCGFCVWFMMRNADDERKDGQQQVNVYMQNSQQRRAPPPQSVSGSSRRTKKSQPPSSVTARSSNGQSRRKPRATRSAGETLRRSLTFQKRRPGKDPSAYAESAPPVLNAPSADDPPEEEAIVPYKSNSTRGRDPTFYGDKNPDQAEPEGTKIDKKKSMFGDAALIDEVHSERKRSARKSRQNRRGSLDRLKQSFKLKKDAPQHAQSDRGTRIPHDIEDQRQYQSENMMASEPEGLTSDEVEDRRERKARKKSSKSKRRSMGERVKDSFRWHHDDAPLDIEALEEEDQPSILTAPPPPEREEKRQGKTLSFADEQQPPSQSQSKSSSRRKKGKRKGKGGFTSSFKNFHRRSSSEPVESDGESFHGEDDSGQVYDA